MGRVYDRICNDLKALGYEFRMNDLDETLEYKSGDIDEWLIVDDTQQAKIETAMSDIGYGIQGKKKPSFEIARKAITTLADKNRYHPIKDYFLSLEGKYNPRTVPGHTSPEPYYCHTLATYMTNPDGYFGRFFHRWSVGVIAKVFEQERNPMFVWAGPQRIGKSRLARWVCPLSKHFREGAIDPKSKDNRLRLLDTLIQEVAELGATTRHADVEALKDHITKMHVHERLHYGRRPTRKPAVCSFIGSVNPDGAGFLGDPTGSTRFLTCTVNKINFNYEQMDVHDLWSEAWWFYRNMPRSWELTPEERDAQAAINDAFEMVNALDDVIETHFIITREDNDAMSALEIREAVSLHYRISNETQFNRDLAKVLYKKGLERKREPYQPGQPHRWRWHGIKKRGKAAKLDE
jgi:predicted P-loop ATPase